MINLKETKPYKAVSYNHAAIEKALEKAGSVIADIKYDGVRLNLCVAYAGYNEETGKAEAEACYLSRVAKTIPALDHLNGFSERWAAFLTDDRQPFKDGVMLDGEVMVKGVDFNTGSGLLRTSSIKDKNYEFSTEFYETRSPFIKELKGKPFHLAPKHMKVIIYGVLPIAIAESGEDYDRMNVLMQHDCIVQVALLEQYFPEIEWCIAESFDVFDMVELEKLYESVREAGHEGLVVKDCFGIYRRGKKTGWWKMKPEDEEDGIVQGLIWGTEGKANEGKVIGFQCLLENGVNVDVTNITQEQMDEFTAAVKAHKCCDNGCQFAKDTGMEPHSCSGSCAYDFHPDSNPYQGHQVQIKYMERTPDGSLRHPSFVCFRGTEENPQEKI